MVEREGERVVHRLLSSEFRKEVEENGPALTGPLLLQSKKALLVHYSKPARGRDL